jgi:hypothetical protein
MIAFEKKTDISVEEKSFLRALLYFDIFSYPLTEQELIQFSPSLVQQPAEVLKKLTQEELIFKVGDFYSLQNEPLLVERRLKGNALADKRMKNAHRFSKIVAAFPFVRAVLLSGSISKGYMDEKSDIDYFIITEAERLWIVRTALAVFRRVFLFNSHRHLCTNYFIDTDNLLIPDQNYFTAIELCTVVPMFGNSVIERFRADNLWVKNFLPACHHRSFESNENHFFLKRFFEKITPPRFASMLNLWFMKSTLRHWRKTYASELSTNDFEIAFRTKPGVSRSHPQFFQKKVLNRFAKKVEAFEKQHRVDLML